MDYLFTDLGAEGCCRSLNALLVYILKSQLFGKLGMLEGGGGGGALMVFVLFIYYVN